MLTAEEARLQSTSVVADNKFKSVQKINALLESGNSEAIKVFEAVNSAIHNGNFEAQVCLRINFDEELPNVRAIYTGLLALGYKIKELDNTTGDSRNYPIKISWSSDGKP